MTAAAARTATERFGGADPAVARDLRAVHPDLGVALDIGQKEPGVEAFWRDGGGDPARENLQRIGSEGEAGFLDEFAQRRAARRCDRVAVFRAAVAFVDFAPGKNPRPGSLGFARSAL